MFEYKYLSRKHLKGFDNYKYRAIDTSPLSNYVMHPLWNATVKVIPRWLAPNLLTFLGFVSVVVVALLTSWYDYHWVAAGGPGEQDYDIPNYMYTISAVLIFLAYNLDGIDGKQARRIGVSGPLGEMFDHGLDSYIVFFIPFCLFSVFGRDEFSIPLFRYVILGYLVVGSIVLNFYVSHCEKYNTRVLYLPWGYDIAMWASSLLFLVAGIKGPKYFKMFVFGNVTFAQALEVAIHATGLFTTLPVSIYNVYLSYKNGTGKNLSILNAVRPLWSMTSLIVVVTYWALKSDVMELYPRAFLLLFGTIFSNIASRLIVSEMSEQRCEVFNSLLWPLLAAAAVSLYQPALLNLLLHSVLLVAVLAHLHYGICVVRQMCDHFKVKCFIVPKEKKK